jgi:hypothetical protein
MPRLPAYRVLADGTDITDRLASRSASIEIGYPDNGEGGYLAIACDDGPEPPFELGRPPRSDGIALPRHGAVLAVSIAEPDGRLAPMGTFIVDEVEMTAPPRRLTVLARSADLRGSLKERKRRHWDQTTLGAIVQRLAAEHGLKAGVAPVLATVPVPYIAQLDESDLGFLRRLGRRHDALTMVANGSLLLIPRGFGMAASGKIMPPIEVPAHRVRTVKVGFVDHGRVGGVRARAYDARLARSVERIVGEGGAAGPIHTLLDRTLDPTDAARAARAEDSGLARGRRILALEMDGDASINLGSLITLTGFRDEVEGTSSVTTVRHRIDGRGYRLELKAELPTERAREDKGRERGGRAR